MMMIRGRTSVLLLIVKTLLSFGAKEVYCAKASSVWCQGDTPQHRHCSFKNICVNFELQFLFFYSPEESSTRNADQMRNLVNLNVHDGKNPMNLVIWPQKQGEKKFNVARRIHQTVLIIHRWNPDKLPMVLQGE